MEQNEYEALVERKFDAEMAKLAARRSDAAIQGALADALILAGNARFTGAEPHESFTRELAKKETEIVNSLKVSAAANGDAVSVWVEYPRDDFGRWSVEECGFYLLATKLMITRKVIAAIARVVQEVLNLPETATESE